VNRNVARSNLVNVLGKITQALDAEYKTEAFYQRVLDKDVRDLYNGKMDRGAFVDDMVRLIDQQFDRAWNEGMRENGLDPKADMTDAWAKELDDTKVRELDYVESFADDITQAGKDGTDIKPLRDRVGLWTNRYNQVVNQAQITTANKEDKFAWRLGATEQHCETCQKLNGIVATAKDWQESGYKPQHAPNAMLECGGWRCDCSMEITDEPLTKGGIPD